MAVTSSLKSSMASMHITTHHEPSKNTGFNSKVVWTIPNIHRDDIHGIIQLGDSTLITGSKDGKLVKCSLDGKILNSIAPEGRADRLDYTIWVTALARLNSLSWVHGRRDGSVFLWDNNFKVQKKWEIIPQQEHRCKDRNLSRIMCFGPSATTNQNASSFSLGQATQFSFMDTSKNAPLRTYSASRNDWVYALHPLSRTKMLVVTGPDLAVWESSDGSWEGSYYIIKETYTKPRPFISCLTTVASNTRHIACAIFGGDVRILDYENAACIINWHEHRERVWSVVNCVIDGCAGSLLASSSDDKTFKLWDVRQQRSVFTSELHVGRVSSLLSSGNFLVTATCPSTPSANEGASLICQDLRKTNS